MLPTVAPSIEPKIAPIPKRNNPPAPPERMPQIIPTKGKARIIQDQESFSSSVTILPIVFPEKYPTAELTAITTNKSKIIQDSSDLKFESAKNLPKIEAGGNKPNIKPK